MRSLFRLYILSIILCSLLFITNAISQTNLLPNGDLETVEPNFWNKLNEGDGGSSLMWDLENGHNSMRSLKATKTGVCTTVVGWKSDNNARLYWNNARANLSYTLSFWAKTDGANVNPTSDDGKIGALFAFYSGGNLLGEAFLEVDQSVAATDWTEYTGALALPAGNDPDEMYITLHFGKDATGTVWFDDVGCGSDPWSMWPFNSGMEDVVGWMEWHAGPTEAFCNTVKGDAFSGEWSALLHEWDDNGDEMVFYSEPVPAEPNTWYKFSVWAKWDSINTDAKYLPSNVTPDRDDQRLGMCFFFHKGNIKESFDLTGGDQYFYFDQREAAGDWRNYTVIAKSPDDASGVSCRARFTSYPVGKVWYDDFAIEKIEVHPEILVNGDLETVEPNFWNKLNEGDGGSSLMWDLENGHNSMRSLKATKTGVCTTVVGWKSDNNARLYWNNARANLSYTLSFWAKTDGANVNPTSDDGKIGALFAFYSGGNLLGEAFLEVDQSVAATDWTEYTGALALPAGNDPDEMYITLHFGKDATGTVWFDDVGCGSDPWSMWPFNSGMEDVVGWMEWHAGPTEAFCNTVKGDAFSGEWSALLHEWDDNGDEMVFYSEPVPAEPNTWYKFSVWAKWDSINTDAKYLPSNVTPDRDDQRLGMCFFFHKGNIKESFDLTGGDQYFYFDQREAAGDWRNYTVIAKSPDDASGVSCRARFTSYPVGKVWYDDFSIKPIEAVATGIFDHGNYIRAEIPNEFELGQNYPNPFNPETTIKYAVPQNGHIQIEVYNILGKKVRTLFEGQQAAGTYQVRWDARDDYGVTLSSGVYLITLRSGNFVTAKRVTLLK